MRSIKPINKSVSKDGDEVYKGGLEVMGMFDEGKCIKLSFRSERA